MRILFIGDIVGRTGREAVVALAPQLRNELSADFVIANAENAAGGVGITPALATDLLTRAGVDVLTLGNHAWAKKEIYPYLQSESRILRPLNYPPGAPGSGCGVYETTCGVLAVIVLQGRVFMEPVDDPFRAVDQELVNLQGHANAVVVDMHAEATSEKQAVAWHLDGRVSAVIGTHTHVQTADDGILEGGTAYITDVGMTGPTQSIIGMAPKAILERFRTNLPARFEAADGPAALRAVLVDINEASGRARRIERIVRSA